MTKASRYLLGTFLVTFATIYIPFFVVATLIYFVKIASLTKRFSLTLLDMVTLYLYALPEMLFFSLPLAFIAATSSFFIKISAEREFVSFCSMGYSPYKMVAPVFVLSFLLTLLLLIASFGYIPIGKYLTKEFTQTLQTKHAYELEPRSYGQKFAEFYLYADSKKKKRLNEVVIYKKGTYKEYFFVAESAELKKGTHQAALILYNGYGYTYEGNKLQEAKYKRVDIFESSVLKRTHFDPILHYWSKFQDDRYIKKKMLFYLTISLIPILAIFLVSSFAIYNPRIQKRSNFLIIASVILLFYTTANLMQKEGNFILSIILAVGIFHIGWLLFHLRIARRY